MSDTIIPVGHRSAEDQIVMDAQERLDAFARSRGYDGILSACSYASSAVPQFQAEGAYCVEARDTTWAALAQIKADVVAGLRPVPTRLADIVAELPVLSWPA
ncbi:MAG TPA: hypothetical protein VLJ86_20150 [Ramlibacter sp.]|nr:hypothetical protein [Ramlibacter sp.]